MKHIFKKATLFASLSLLILSFISLSAMPVYAAGNANNNTIIQPTKKQFQSSKTPVYKSTNQTINGYYGGKTQIFHYKAPEAGNYIFYTAGNLDTVGAVFEHNSFLFFNSWYDEVGYNDDQYANYYTSRTRNTNMVVELDKDEDYYVCIRGYGSQNGYFTLHITRNLDKIESNSGGTWTKDNGFGVHWKKQYYTAEQVEIAYQILANAAVRNVILNHYIDSGLRGALSEINKILGVFFSLLPLPYVVSVGLGIAGSILQAVIDSAYKSNAEIGEMLAGFEESAKIETILTNVNGHPATVYVSQNGIVVVDSLYYMPYPSGTSIIQIPIIKKSFSVYKSIILVGLFVIKALGLKTIFLFLIVSVSLSLLGCGKKTHPNNNEINVLLFFVTRTEIRGSAEIDQFIKFEKDDDKVYYYVSWKYIDDENLDNREHLVVLDRTDLSSQLFPMNYLSDYPAIEKTWLELKDQNKSISFTKKEVDEFLFEVEKIREAVSKQNIASSFMGNQK